MHRDEPDRDDDPKVRAHNAVSKKKKRKEG